MEKYQKLWECVLNDLRELYDEDIYNELFEPLKVNKYLNGYIYILVELSFIKTRIDRLYINRINDLLTKYTTENIKFKFVTKEELASEPINTIEKDIDFKYRPGNLNATYNFQNFVVGKSNHFACTMSLKVADQPGVIANPLYIFGGVGLGKTHLMQAIGNFILDKDINQKVLYVKADEFSDDYFNSTKTKNFEEFYNKYRNIDVFLVDDIQILSGKEKTQMEFFKLFNILYQANKQIIITSDRPAMSLKGMMDRLTTRFASGLSIDIGIPDLDLRVNILRKKLQMETDKKDSISDDVLNYIASSFITNIRELEGALKRVIYYCIANNIEINLQTAEEALEPLLITKKNSNKLNENNYDKVQSVVSDFYNITISDLIGSKRQSKYIIPRHIAMYIIKQKYDLPYKRIGELFGNRDHSTVLSACEKIENEIKINNEMKLAVENILKKVEKE